MHFTCEHCGVEFQRRLSPSKAAKQKYCSLKCANVASGARKLRRGAGEGVAVTVRAIELRQTPLAAYRERAMCPDCEGREMLPTGTVRQLDPHQYEHACKGCGGTAWLPDKYPTIVYVELRD